MKLSKIAAPDFKPLCAAALISCLAVFPSFAAETREEYQAEAATVRSQMETCMEEIKKLREEDQTVLQKYQAIKSERKENKTLSIEEENWEKIRELRQQIGTLHSENRKSSEENGRKDLKSVVQNGNYDEALSVLNQSLEDRQAALESQRQISEIWKQIDELLK